MFETLVKTGPNVRLVVTLYGTVSPERMAQEQRELQHRYDMLTPMTAKEKEEFEENFDFSEGDDDDF